MMTSTSVTSGQQIFLIQENNTLDLLEKLVSHLTLYIPSTKDFQSIYIRNARGTENINTQDMDRQKMTFHGGINKIVIDINRIPNQSEIEIQ